MDQASHAVAEERLNATPSAVPRYSDRDRPVKAVPTILCTARFSAPCRWGAERIVGPGMLRITAAHLCFDILIAAAPKPWQIAWHLYRPVRRRQQLDHERYDAPGDARMRCHTK